MERSMFEEREKIEKKLAEEYPDIDPVEQVKVFMRGAVELLPSQSDLINRLRERRPLRIKLGVDPTSTDLHLGHTVVLQKLRQLQKLGHMIDFVIGSFTALIGDPSGRNKTRPMLTEAEILENARTYTDQAFKLLDRERTAVTFNGWWLKPLTFADIVKLSSRITLARLIERDDFSQRLKEGTPISAHEILYPIMQAYDSVILHTDIELGGTDQKFNLLTGRDFQTTDNQSPQIVLMMPILVGTDGKEKMSKSLMNYIGITDPPFDIFAKTMSIPDESILGWFELLTDVSLDELAEISRKFEAPDNRMHLKMRLASALVEKYHGKNEAKECYERWVREKQQRKLPEPDKLNIVTVKSAELKEGKIWIIKLISAAGIKDRGGAAISRAEIRRKIKEGAVKIDGETFSDPDAEIAPKEGAILQFGRQHAFKIKVE